MPEATANSSSSWLWAIAVTDLKKGAPTGVRVGGLDLVLVVVNGRLSAFSGTCPHKGALLAGGELREGLLVCPHHGWSFNAETGQHTQSTACLTSFPVEVRADGVWVKLPRLVPAQASVASNEAARSVAALPGPSGWPWLGMAPVIDVPRIHEQLEEWARQYGPIYRLPFRRGHLVVVAEPALADEILCRRPDGFRRSRHVAALLAEMEAAGVFSAEGDAWRTQRRLTMEALSPRRLRDFYPVLQTIGHRLYARWARAAETGETVDIQRDAMRFTVDVTTWLSLGRDLNTVEGKGDFLQKHLECLLPVLTGRLFALFPVWRWMQTPAQRRLRRALRGIHEWVDPQIAHIRRELEGQVDQPRRAPRTFLEAMIAARDEHGEPYSDQVVFANALNMLIAGEDTTANTIAWAVHELCDAPESVQSLRTEADAIMAHAVPSAEALDTAPFAMAVAHETTRLRPVVPTMFFEALRNERLPGLEVPKGTVLALVARSFAAQSNLLIRPEAFAPERFLEPGLITALQRANAHLPFGSGPRMCPARTLALQEIRLVLLLLYRAFDVERVGTRDEVHERYGFTMEPTGLRVRLRPRDKPSGIAHRQG